jgi:hypothetical protein
MSEEVPIAAVPNQMMPDKITLEKTLAVLKECTEKYFINPYEEYLIKMKNALADFYRIKVQQFPSGNIEMDEIFNTINKIDARIKDTNKPTLLREIFLDIRDILTEADTKKRERVAEMIEREPEATLEVFDINSLGLQKTTKFEDDVNDKKKIKKLEEFADELELLIPKTTGTDKIPIPGGKIGAKINSILYNAFQVMFNSFDFSWFDLNKIPLSKENMLTLYKIALFDTEKKNYETPRGYYATKIVIDANPTMMITYKDKGKYDNMLTKLLAVKPNRQGKLVELIQEILNRNYVITPGDICRDSKEVKCPEGSFSEINLLKTLEIIGEYYLGMYLRNKRKQIIEIVDFIKNKKNSNKAVTNPELKKDLLVIDYILRKGNTSTSDKGDKKNWVIPDGMFASLIQAIKLENNSWPDLPPIKVDEIIKERKKHSGAWFGGKTRKGKSKNRRSKRHCKRRKTKRHKKH